MVVKVVAIIPKKKITAKNIQPAFNQYLQTFANNVLQEMSEYPSPQAWKSRTPIRGPRAFGRRTGAYGRGWRATVSPNSATISNSVPYAAQVGGSRRRGGQVPWLTERGWKSIDDVRDLGRQNLPDASRYIFSSG